MGNHYDAAVIGGGIIGHSASYQLNKHGVHTVVFEKGRSGREATRAAAGMLGVHTEHGVKDAYYDFCVRSRDLYNSLEKELKDLTAIDIGLSKKGMYHLALNEQEKHAHLCKQSAFPALKWFNEHELRERLPHSSSQLAGALYSEKDGHVEPAHVCEAFKRGALSYGGALFEETDISAIGSQDGKYKLKSTRGECTAEKIIIASGVGSSKWFDETGLVNPIVPTKGECFTVYPKKTLITETIFHKSCYVVPKGDGRLIIGATSLSNNDSSGTTIGGLAELIDRLREILPGIHEENLADYWAG
ncbi:FAD-binding oxidoreductase [Halobacillus salinarum]|uniref:FAD-binding oxidoreductase n=1 Tax=Halobacillus salinarum TaxID=2932257 RepID=A0ABY4EED5_9BACI|nr:FAD-dependent oxidoreductase [Halobacillus salinarum]UOQ42833.1 FAD-binding oxidoreductase [Halobacillus salinarum]